MENNFVAANTLIALDKPKEATFGDHLLKEKEKELKDIRQQHFDARTYKEKQALRKKDKAKREEIAALLKQFGFPAKTASLVAAWNPYDRLKSSEWFDPEYMFEIHTGFDVVIGNPPYGAELDTNLKDYLKNKHAMIVERIRNSFLYFIGEGYNLLKKKGILSYIIPNEFLFQIYMTKARNYFLNNSKILSVVNLGEDVFDAIVPSCIIVLENSKAKQYELLINDLRNSKYDEIVTKLNVSS